MKLMNLFKREHTIVVVQCRLSSTRLPRKALLPLGEKTVLEWTLNAMKMVKADSYVLAVDTESEAELLPIAKKCGFELFAGSKEDVLGRFCDVIEKYKAAIVLRATADNPFLFYEAASSLLNEYRVQSKNKAIDYMTYSGLPHGSGIEILNAQSLLQARTMTNLPYDHEHVGPALYNHTDSFNCIFLKSPEEWNHPELRTTIDTASDYHRAQSIVRIVNSTNAKNASPFSAQSIVETFENPCIKHPIILFPSTKKGQGTGHLHRCLEIALNTGADIFIPQDADLEQTSSLVTDALSKGLSEAQIIHNLDILDYYHLALTDMFVSPSNYLLELSEKIPVVAIDEGSSATDCVDFLLDILPSAQKNRYVNLSDPSFIPRAKNVRSAEMRSAKIHTALVVLGGEDPASLAFPSAISLAQCNIYVTAIVPNLQEIKNQLDELENNLKQYIKLSEPVNNLKEKLYEYDLVVTHYGFTAFEAMSAGCAVILLGTTPLHQTLAQNYGFASISSGDISSESFKKLLKNPENLIYSENKTERSLSDFVLELAEGERLPCPICQSHESLEKDALVARTSERTFRRCKKCGMLYMSWTKKSVPTEYKHSYFFEDYEKQYGKTYLEDFQAIKSQGIRRINLIDQLYRRSHSSVTPSVLDIGCAFGPFLDAASDAGWQVFGTDISEDAVHYVQNNLHFPAAKGAFPKIDVTSEFGIEKFDAVTMWFVIEHFKDADSVLKAVSKILKKGGIFAFSTPSASGVSAKYNTQSFFTQSPADHYTLWEPKKTSQIVRRYGFEVAKIVVTGIHPERFPKAQQNKWNESSIQLKMLSGVSHIMKLGDTFEVYCRKVEN